jgi:hypothetical protein
MQSQIHVNMTPLGAVHSTLFPDLKNPMPKAWGTFLYHECSGTPITTSDILKTMIFHNESQALCSYTYAFPLSTYGRINESAYQTTSTNCYTFLGFYAWYHSENHFLNFDSNHHLITHLSWTVYKLQVLLITINKDHESILIHPQNCIQHFWFSVIYIILQCNLLRALKEFT